MHLVNISNLYEIFIEFIIYDNDVARVVTS